MRPRFSLPLVLLAAALGAAAPLRAQQVDPNTPVSSVDPTAPPAAPPAAQGEPVYPPAEAALPQAATPPRTLRAYWHVFIAFALSWLLLFGYAITLGRRFAALERDVRRLGSA